MIELTKQSEQSTPGKLKNKPSYMTKSWRVIREKTKGADQKLRDFEKYMRSLNRPKQIAYALLMSKYAGNPLGIELRSKSRDAWAFVLPNVHGDHSFRIQYFDCDGFSGHSCYATIEDAVENMVSEGYQVEDAGALDRLSSTEQWRVGLLRATIRQKQQHGLITWQEMMDQFAAVC
jgi:hypothetical protein